MTYIQLYNKLSSLPSDLKQEVADFIDFLLLRRKEKPKEKKRTPGLAKGLIKMNPDFDQPIDDFKDYVNEPPY